MKAELHTFLVMAVISYKIHFCASERGVNST